MSNKFCAYVKKINIKNIRMKVLLLYFLILFLYDIFVMNDGEIKTALYLKSVVIIFIGCIVIYGILFMLRKNPFCSEKIVNNFYCIWLIIFTIGSIALGISYFWNGFTIGAFLCPLGSLIVLREQRKN